MRRSVTCRRCRVWTWIETPEGSGTAILTCPACGHGITQRVSGHLPPQRRQEADDLPSAGSESAGAIPGAPSTQEIRPLVGTSPPALAEEAGAPLCPRCSGLTNPVLVGGEVIGHVCVSRCRSRSGVSNYTLK